MDCPDCGEDALYDKRNGKRCAVCGYRWKPETGLVDEMPSKPHDAVCGEQLNNLPNHREEIPRMIEPMCNDGSRCSFSPTTIKEVDGDYLAVCTTHSK